MPEEQKVTLKAAIAPTDYECLLGDEVTFNIPAKVETEKRIVSIPPDSDTADSTELIDDKK